MAQGLRKNQDKGHMYSHLDGQDESLGKIKDSHHEVH